MAAAAAADIGGTVEDGQEGEGEEQVLLHCAWLNRDLWFDSLRAAGMPVVWADQVRDWSAVRFAVGWNFTPELLAKMPSLRAVASMGAGVDHAMGPGLLPPGVDVVRIVDPLMAQRMATWVIWAVITFQRKMDEYARAQADKRWDKSIENYRPWDNGCVRVGVMGFGAMGRAAARLLLAAGYDVAAWARTPRGGRQQQEEVQQQQGDVPGTAQGQEAAAGPGLSGGGAGGPGTEDSELARVRVYAGRGELREFVERTDVLVCLLPLTPETQGIINSELLSWLPRGSAVVNAARGKHVDEQALLAALDEGHLGGAVLDVFTVEPLPPDSPLWGHPRIRITPHVSSITDVPNAVEQIAKNYRRFKEGRPLINVANREAGY